MHRDVTVDASSAGETMTDGSAISQVRKRTVPPAGALIAGRYRLGAQIGAGGSGRVHLATRVADGREVVLKMLSGGGRAGRDQLRAEARTLATLQHPNVVRFVEHAESAEATFVALEAVRGNDLAARIASGRVTRGGAVVWLYELASALDHVHAQGFVHRDLKPANVMIDEASGGRSVLVDFGLASEYRLRTGPRASAFVVGTPEYMAPEQALALEADIGPAADRYALAAIALELFTGERPYPKMPIGRLLTTILESPPRRPSALGVGGPELDAVFARAMARDPERRYGSAREQIEAIVRALPRVRGGTHTVRDVHYAATVRAKVAA
jgi:serine/threonine-protein kinase